MQITNSFRDGALPSSAGGRAPTPDVAKQIRQQRLRHSLIMLRRTLGFWWYRILLIVVAGIAAAYLAPLALSYPKELIIFAGAGPAIILLYWLFKRLEFALLATALASTAFFPSILSIKSLSLGPAPILIVVTFSALIVQTAFHVRKPVWPSLYALWPVLGLIAMALVSQIMIQFTWTHAVPHKINTNPIYYDELFGVALFFLPFIILITTTACLTNRDKWLEYIKIGYMAMAVIAALVIIVKFKSINATIYTFRFSTPTIGWMSLRALAQLMGLGAMLAWATFLNSRIWRWRIVYGLVTLICLAGVYLSLENSWWLEVGVAFVVITFVFSRKLFLLLCFAAIPLLPLVKNELAKLQQVKSADYYRLIIWQDALRIWKLQPIFGVGPGNFWAYDQRFTQLPLLLRDCNKTGLCVAHNGYLQVLGEMGPLGVFFYLSFIAVMAYISFQLFRRSNTSETVGDRILGLVSIGLVLGSAAGDFFAGSFFMQPRQIGGFNDFPQVMTSWIIWGCVMYKDQLWRMERRRLKKEGKI